MLTAALIAAFTVPSTFAGNIDQNSTLNKDDNVTYNGKIYTMSGSGNFSKRTFTEYIAVGDHMEEGTATTPWQSFANNQSQTYGHTLRMTGISGDQAVVTDFSPFSLGGLIVEAGAGTYTLSRTGTATDFNGVGDVNLNIKGSLTLLSNNAPGIKFFKGGDWMVASSKTLTFQTTQAVVLDNGIAVDIKGGGKVKVAGNLITNAGATIAIASGTTLEVTGTATLGAAITNNGALTFGVDTAVVSDFSAFGGDVEYSDGDNGFVSKGTYKLIEGEGTVTGLSKVSYGGTTYNVDETEHTVTMSDYTTYHLYTQGAGVVVDAAAETARTQGATLTTVDVKNSGATITVNSAQQLVNLTVATGAGATINGSGSLAVTGGLAIEAGGSLAVDAGSALKLGVTNAGELLKTITGAGDIHIAADTLFAGSSAQGTPATTHVTGALIVDQGKTLQIGTTNTGGYTHTYVDMTSFNKVLLDGSTLWIHNDEFDLKNVTVTEKGGTVTIHDTAGQNNNTLNLKGTTQLNGTLTFNGTWKQMFTIDKLDGTGTLKLAGTGNDKQIVNIGGGSAGELQIGKSNVEANITGNLTLGGLTGTEGTVNAAQGLTFNVAENGEYSYTGTLTIGGQVVKTGLGSQSISAYEMHKAMDVQAGTLVLNGAYSIDNIALDADSTIIFYDNEGNVRTSGFRNVAGAKTVYTVAEGAVVDTTTGGASFTEGGEAVELSNGKYLIAGTTDYSTLWVNEGELSYDAYYAPSAGALATAKVEGGATLIVGTHAVGTLEYQTNGSTINLAGTGTVDAISGTGTLNLLDGAVVTVPNQTLGANQSFVTSGAGTLNMQNLMVNGGGAVATLDSKATLHQITMGSGTVNLNSDVTMDRFVLSMENSASTMNIGKDANVHVTGTKLSVGNSDASFMVSNWNQVNTLNIEGRLIAEAGISARDGKANINVKDGGTLELHQGLLYMKNTAQYTNINVESGGTLLTAGNANDQAGAGLHVNLNNGSTLQGYYAEGVDTAAIAQTLTLAGTVTFDVEAGKTLQLNSNIAGEGVTIAKTGAGALALNGDANVLYNALNVQEGTIALNGTFDLSHITHEQGTVKYFKDDQPGTVESDNGFAKYVGEVQLVSNKYGSVSVGEGASLTLDGYNVTYDAATGKAASSEINLGTFYINKDSESVSSIVAVAPKAGVALADGTKLVVDAELTGAISVNSGRGLVQIESGQTLQTTAAAIELSGSGTYALAAKSLNKGGATLGQDWDGYLRITNFQPGNGQNLSGLGSALELNGFKGWDNNWAGTMAMDIRLTDYVEGETTKVAWSCGAFSSSEPMPIGTFTGTWSGTGTFKQDCASGKYMGYEYQGNIADWTGAFITTCETVLTFSNAATDVNIDISKESGKLGVIVNTGATFTKSVTADTLTINAGKSATLKGETTIGSLACAGSLAVDAGEHTVTINGITGLSNTITLTSGTLSLNGTVNISEDMPVTGGNTYYIGGQDPENGFKTVEGKLQVVAIGDGSHFIEGEGISYQYGGKEIATSLTEGAITVEPTTTYGTFFVRKANTTESLEHAIQVATEASAALTAVVMSADTTLAANAEATYDLTLDEGASATVNVTAATTIGTLTGTALTINGDSTLTIGTVASAATLNGSGDLVINGPTVTINGNNKASFTGDVEVKAGTLKLGNSSGDQFVLGAYNYSGDTPRTITIRDGATIDINGHGDGNYVYTLDGGRLTNTGAGKNANNSQTVGLILTKDSFVGGEGSNEFWLRQRSAAAGGDATKLNLGEYNLTKQGNSTFGLYNTAVTGTGSLVVEGGTVNFSGGTIASNVVLNGGALAGTLVLADDITVTAKTNSTMGAGFNVGEHTLTLATDEGKAITFSSKYTHGAGTLKADGTVKFTSGLTPNAGTVEVAGEVTVSGSSLDLSNGGNSKGKLNVTGTGVLNVNNGMWMNTNAIDIAEGGTMNIAGLHIVGEADGATIATTAGNQNYGTENNKYVITNAAVTGTTNINLGNKLVDSTLTTGAYTMTLKNAESSYDAVFVSTGGTLVIDADINLAGVLQSSGAITVNEEKSLTLGAGSTVYQTITNNGAVSLTGITLGAGFQEQQEGSAYYDIDGNVTTEDQNHYDGSATTYVQVVNGGTSTGSGIKWNENSYDLNDAGRIIVGQGGADYSTFFVKGGTVELSKLNEGTSNVKVEGGTLVVDNPAAGITIEVTDEGTITGEAVTPEDVKIANWASAEFTKDVQGVGYEFKTGDAQQGELGTVTITNFGGDAAYSVENPLMMVRTQTLEMTDYENDATVTNMVMVNEVVNETGHKLTLENAASVNLKSMTIGQGSTVEALYTDAQDAQVEGTVTITESLTAGGGKLYANLTLEGHEGEQLLYWDLNGAGENALTLGSVLTLDTQSGLIQLDNETMQAIAALEKRGDYLELVLDAGTGLQYNGKEWFDGVFSRTYTNAGGELTQLGGDYNVQLLENGNFGIVKFSNVPEPTTGTLSLLALAALAARRRKH